MLQDLNRFTKQSNLLAQNQILLPINMLEVKNMSRYGMVGIIGTIIHFGTLIFLVELFAIDALLSSTIGFLLTVIVSYLINYYWTFQTQTNHSSTFAKYLLVSCFGLVLNYIIMRLGLNVLHLHYQIAQAIVILAIPVTNYIMNRYWTFI